MILASFEYWIVISILVTCLFFGIYVYIFDEIAEDDDNDDSSSE